MAMPAPPGYRPVASTSYIVRLPCIDCGKVLMLASQPPPAMSQAELDQKSRKWLAMQGKKYGGENKNRVIDTGKQQLPPEHVRKLIKDRGELNYLALKGALG